MDDVTKRRAGRVLRFAVTGALLVGGPAACGTSSSTSPNHTINEPPEETVNEPPQEETPNEPPQDPQVIANEPPQEQPPSGPTPSTPES